MTRASVASDLALISESIGRIAGGIAATHASVLRQGLAGRSATEAEYAPALFCLGLAETLSGRPDAGLAGAECLALLVEMGRIFVSLEGDRTTGVAETWGMARALNAGDAFFGHAQERLISGTESLAPQRRLRVMASLDRGARSFCEALGAGARLEEAVKALYPAAAAIAADLAGTGDTQLERLVEYGEKLARAPERPLAEVIAEAAAVVQAA
ncbi:MAG TPA: hypothetical protein VNN21_01540 [Dehalococcoidia bacterium]|nr:hypothetical protein [Dehalococcoidia bacterium]